MLLGSPWPGNRRDRHKNTSLFIHLTALAAIMLHVGKSGLDGVLPHQVRDSGKRYQLHGKDDQIGLKVAHCACSG